MDSIESLWILERYSLLILPALVVAEQLGIPLPAVPALLGVGALAAAGRVSVPMILGVIAVVAFTVDLTWYELGRRRGREVLAKLCRISLRPDTCVGRTERIFGRHGATFVLVAKFVPGLTTVVPPLAGIAGIGRARFAIYEVGGVLLWAGTWVGLGYFFSDAVASIALTAARLGRMLAVVIVAAVAAYVLVRYLRRRRSLRTFRLVPPVAEQAKETGPRGLALFPRARRSRRSAPARLSREAARLHDARRLNEMVLLVHDDDAAGIHHAVRDEAGHRRRDRDRVEIESAARFHETHQSFLLREKRRDDGRVDVAARRVEGRPRLHLASRVGAERVDDQPSQKAG
jgi:membrane protein DedA with SNARE-associated domain